MGRYESYTMGNVWERILRNDGEMGPPSPRLRWIKGDGEMGGWGDVKKWLK